MLHNGPKGTKTPLHMSKLAYFFMIGFKGAIFYYLVFLIATDVVSILTMTKLPKHKLNINRETQSSLYTLF